MSKYVLILGASSLQVPLIKYVKEKGFSTIVVSIPGDYPGFELADMVLYMDIRDGEAILDAVKGYEIVSVITDETDISVPTVAYLSNRLELPGNNMDISLVYSNKYLMRMHCQRIGVPVPPFCQICSKDEVDSQLNCISFPAMMKPEDSQGSRGVFRVDSEHDIDEHFIDSLKYSKTGRVIIEDYFEGHEVVCEGFVLDGEYLNWGIADRKYFNLPNKYIPSQTIFPSSLPDTIKERILNYEKKIHGSLKPSFGMIHSEYLVNLENGNVILVETALRGGGVFISSHLVPLYTGFNNYELLLGCSMGKNYDLSMIKKCLHRKSSAYICYYLPEGKVISIKGFDKLAEIPSVNMVDTNNICLGFTTEKMTNKTQRLGPIILSAENREVLEQDIERCKRTLDITVETTSGSIGGVIWD